MSSGSVAGLTPSASWYCSPTASWTFTPTGSSPESRIGLVGANGTGKSTIMKILAGSESLDYGAISRAKGISTGYLPQDGLTLTGRTIFAECMSVFAELDAIEKEMGLATPGGMLELNHSIPPDTPGLVSGTATRS